MTKADKEGQRKTPILRFKGFTDAWEQRKLGEIGKIIAGGDKDSKKLRKKGKYPVLANNLENNGIIGYYKNNYKIEAPAITVTARGNIGNAIARFTNFTPVVRLLVLKTNLDVKFIEQSINNINFFIESTGVPQLTVPQLASYSIFIPKKFEQHKIGNLFKFIDNIVALYDRKLKLLSQVKKYFLDNLFTEKECPNLRFTGFTDAWEQRKLLKVCKKEDNKRIPIKEHERKEGNTPYFGANGIQGYIDGYTHDGTNILIAEDGANNVRNYPIKLITGKIWVNNHAHVLKVNTKTNNGNFLVGAIKKINFYRYLVGSSRYKLTAESLNQVKIKIAKQSEQEKIGELLKNIEELLTLYENKKQNLIEIKKELLNTMFI